MVVKSFQARLDAAVVLRRNIWCKATPSGDVVKRNSKAQPQTAHWPLNSKKQRRNNQIVRVWSHVYASFQLRLDNVDTEGFVFFF